MSGRISLNVERARLEESDCPVADWRRWGPYLSERQWGTVREDYSADGSAWEYFPHDHARSRAYRWGEDGLAGFSDDQCRLCFAVALWNGHDPILKERLFGLTNAEGNHGEDVKELYYYLDATPTHSYLRMLYKYPHGAFPYEELIRENRNRGRDQTEFELLDTGIFEGNRYFDVFVEHGKAGPEDLLTRITVHNRGPAGAAIHVLPQLWFRNTWSWEGASTRPELRLHASGATVARHATLSDRHWHADGNPPMLFCENETNAGRVWGADDATPYPKDAFHDYVVHARRDAVNPSCRGTKAAAHYRLTVPAGGSVEVRLRLTDRENGSPFADFEHVLRARRAEADAFYAEIQKDIRSEDARRVQRQAFAGMIWSKQFYSYDVARWLDGDPAQPSPPAKRLNGRNREWEHLNNAGIHSMPDKWEYPWYAAWDLAFHCLPLAMIDADFAKHQLDVLTREWYMHPNGQLPAYEWAFGDVNPPVHAWATWRVFQIEREQRRLREPSDPGDLAFLERVFHKLLLNFTWWVNRKDAEGRNVFQGGFLGMDNVGVFDRSAPLPTGGHIDQSDGTAWMAMYSLNLMRIALELGLHNRVYEDIATKFFEHFLYIAKAMSDVGHHGIGLWDEKDGFFYDVLHLPGDHNVPLKVRNMVGLVPLFAVQVLEPELLDNLPNFTRRLEWFLNNRPELATLVSRWHVRGRGEQRLLSLLRGHRMKCLLRRMLDPNEFLSDYGVRALSRAHRDEPYVFDCAGRPVSVRYEPGESSSGLFGGNSNWRGPVWFPVNYLIIESIQRFHLYYGDEFNVECPTGSGRRMTLSAIAQELSDRLAKIFLRDAHGRRPVFGDCDLLQTGAHFRDHVLFHEYFHGDSGCGIGASHQTGWTGLVACLLGGLRVISSGARLPVRNAMTSPGARTEPSAPGEDLVRGRER